MIAAVEGYAVAGGMELALWADMRVVGEDATFGIFCRRFGVPLIDLGTIRLPRLIGHSQAMDLILTGRPVEAQEALQMGIANRAGAEGRGAAHAIAIAKDMARFPQMCMRDDRLGAAAMGSRRGSSDRGRTARRVEGHRLRRDLSRRHALCVGRGAAWRVRREAAERLSSAIAVAALRTTV